MVFYINLKTIIRMQRDHGVSGPKKTQYRRRKMREEDIPLGGGNICAILISGFLMFLFYEVGWPVMGTIFLFIFLVAGSRSLFPIIAAFIGFGWFMLAHAYESTVFCVLVFWIIILLLFEFAARMMIAEEKDGKQNASDKENK